MTQIHRALSHYWSLRDQGKSPDEAQTHTRLRFGVELDPEAPLASTAVETDAPAFSVGDRIVDNDGDTGTVIENPENSPFDFRVRYDGGTVPAGIEMGFWYEEADEMGLRLIQTYGSDFCKTIFSSNADRQGIMGTA